MNLARRRFIQGATAAAAVPALSRVAMAQAYPARPIRFIVPLAPGGGLDFVARLVGEYTLPPPGAAKPSLSERATAV